jgi:hypothetical protein
MSMWRVNKDIQKNKNIMPFIHFVESKIQTN